VIAGYIFPALEYILKKKGVRDKYIAVGAGFLLRCWGRGLCGGAGPFLQLCRDDPVCAYVEDVVRKRDADRALGLYAWYLKCTGRRAVKPLDVEGAVEYYDYTDELAKRYPVPGFPC
jgi:hypothetical protein